jgi:hypothetical protein
VRRSGLALGDEALAEIEGFVPATEKVRHARLLSSQPASLGRGAVELGDSQSLFDELGGPSHVELD